jgi:hypothetical protein
MAIKRLSKSVSVRTFPAPPAGFDLSRAGQRTRERYGFPPQPAEAPLRRHWDETLAARPQIVQPEFQLLESIDLPPPAIKPEDGAAALALKRSSVLAGGEAKVSGRQGTVRWVESTWTIPNIYPAPGPRSGTRFSCATWIGLAGPGSSLQAGMYTYTYYYRGQIQRVFFPWWRWFPGSMAGVSNFPVALGDVLSCVVCLDLDSLVRARLSFHNVTTKQATSFIVTAPSGTQLSANTAGWMMQADQVRAGERFLARMGLMYFDRCNAGLMSGPDILHPTDLTYMTNAAGDQDVAYTNQLSETLLQLKYNGP